MSSTDYSFDGLDAMEKNLSQMIEQEYPAEFRKMVIQIAQELNDKIKEKTPVSQGKSKRKKGGYLQGNWHVGRIEKRGNEYYIEITNNTEYAEFVEYGHRTRGGKGFVKGSHMMELSIAEVQEFLPAHLKNWIDTFISTHDL